MKKLQLIHFPLDHLANFEKAIQNVKQKYCIWANQDGLPEQKTERVFTYELYHQYRTLTNDDSQYDQLRLDGEIGKQLILSELENCDSEYVLRQRIFSPDLVIHFAQTDRDERNQKLIVEVKTKYVGNQELGESIIKLNHYIKILNFQYAVLLSVNTSFDELCERIQAIFPDPNDKSWENRFSRIYIMNYKNEYLERKTLYDLLTD